MDANVTFSCTRLVQLVASPVKLQEFAGSIPGSVKRSFTEIYRAIFLRRFSLPELLVTGERMCTWVLVNRSG